MPQSVIHFNHCGNLQKRLW